MTDIQTLPASSRIWIYQSDKPFRNEDLPQLKSELNRFVQSWVSHKIPLRATSDVLHNRFVVFMVDENQVGAGGCSLDVSTRFLRKIGEAYDVDLFDRMTFAWLEGDAIHTADSETFSRLYREGKITGDTLVFDNLIKTKGELDSEWLKPLKDSWHMKFV